MRLILVSCAAALAAACSESESSLVVPSVEALVVPVGTEAMAQEPSPPAAGAPTATGIDPCVVGTWRLTPENARAFYESVMGGTGMPVEIVSIDGVATATLTAEGKSRYDNGTIRVTARPTVRGASGMQVTMTLSGTGSSDFTAQNGTLTYTNAVHDFNTTMQLGGGGRARDIPLNSAQSAGSPYGDGAQTYRCTADALELSMPSVSAAVRWVR